MSTTNKFTEEDSEALAFQQASELQQQICRNLQQLSLEQLQMVADFADSLLAKEIEEATQEIQEIPGVSGTLRLNQKVTSRPQLANWRNLRSDI